MNTKTRSVWSLALLAPVVLVAACASAPAENAAPAEPECAAAQVEKAEVAAPAPMGDAMSTLPEVRYYVVSDT